MGTTGRRAEYLKKPADSETGQVRDIQETEAGRVPWIPVWIGIFERIIYVLLIGSDVAGGAAFIGVWIGIKIAGGWQSWSKGTTYGRATLGIGLLGNAMSVLFGALAGMVARHYVQLHP